MQRYPFNEVYQQRRAQGFPGWHEEHLYPERIRRLLQFLDRNGGAPGDRVLVLGCGAGHTVLAIAQKGFRAFGIDISECAISWARERLESAGMTADLRIGDVIDLEPYSADAFDFVFDDYCLHCIIGSDRRTCCSNVYRVLKLGGVFHAGTERMRRMIPAMSGPYRFDVQTQCLIRQGAPDTYYTREGELVEEVGRVGFTVVWAEQLPRQPAAPPCAQGREWIDAVKPGVPPERRLGPSVHRRLSDDPLTESPL